MICSFTLGFASLRFCLRRSKPNVVVVFQIGNRNPPASRLWPHASRHNKGTVALYWPTTLFSIRMPLRSTANLALVFPQTHTRPGSKVEKSSNTSLPECQRVPRREKRFCDGGGTGIKFSNAKLSSRPVKTIQEFSPVAAALPTSSQRLGPDFGECRKMWPIFAQRRG